MARHQILKSSVLVFFNLIFIADAGKQTWDCREVEDHTRLQRYGVDRTL